MPWQTPGACRESRRARSFARGRFDACPFVSLGRRAKQASIIAAHEGMGAMDVMAYLGTQVAVGMPSLRDPLDAENGLRDFPMRGACKRTVERLKRSHVCHRGTVGTCRCDGDRVVRPSFEERVQASRCLPLLR